MSANTLSLLVLTALRNLRALSKLFLYKRIRNAQEVRWLWLDCTNYYFHLASSLSLWPSWMGCYDKVSSSAREAYMASSCRRPLRSNSQWGTETFSQSKSEESGFVDNHEVGQEVPPSPLQVSHKTPGISQVLECSLLRTLGERNNLSHIQSTDPQKLQENQCVLFWATMSWDYPLGQQG